MIARSLPFVPASAAFLLFSFLPVQAQKSAAPPPPYAFGFESPLGPEWKFHGNVAVDDGDAFQEGKALRLSRAEQKVNEPADATAPAFPAIPGIWRLGVAARVDIYSPDNSFNGKVWLECLNAEGKVIERFPVAAFDRQKTWETAGRDVEFPAGTASARFYFEMNKTHGTFKVDALSAGYVSALRSETQTVDKILFSTAQTGNLLFPSDPRKVTVSVETFADLPEGGRTLAWSVRDYWGAEQGAPAVIELRAAGGKKYEGEIDLAGLPLEEGRYYEIHASVPQKTGEPASNYSSFAILPEAPAKKYKPEEIPFTARNWDNRIEAYYFLADRLGIRICGIWGRFGSAPPYEAQALHINLVEKLGMGALTTSPIFNIEHQRPGWEKFDETCLREGIRNLIEKAGPVRPLVINLGNEPLGDPEVVKRSVAAYKLVYQEIRKIDPSITVVGSSAGTIEEFFKQGFGEWCDAYDFHTYEDSKYIREIFKRYDELFKKYGHPKPIWATEVGLNSQGLGRSVVSADMIKKFTAFFAAGGANVSWFGIIYPDPNLKLSGGADDAHNVFDCRYSRYAPKLDAVTYYNMVNAIGIKKFVAEKEYPEGVYAALFRDRENQCFQVLWKEEGRSDVMVPLPGVEKARLIRIDGRVRELDAGGRGLALSVGTDPLILLYESAKAPLADKLEAPGAMLEPFGETGFVLGRQAVLSVRGKEAGWKADLVAPPLWKVKSGGEAGKFDFAVTPPEESRVREADLLVSLKDEKGRAAGELALRVPVEPKLALRVLPEPDAGNEKPGVRLLLSNNGTSAMQAAWEVSLTGEMELKGGKFDLPNPSMLRFGGGTSGTLDLKSGQTESVVLPLPGADPNRLYRVKALARDGSGTTMTVERYVGGFVGVAHADKAPSLDGTLDEEIWKKAAVRTLDRENHFNPLRKSTASWTGSGDLSATMRFLWDERNLYLGVEVTDDIAGELKQDSAIWSQDGIQLLIDPARESLQKPGKYDYALAIGSKGPQAWCYLTADGALAPVQEAGDIRVSAKRKDEKTGNMTYEIAIPWNRIAPFKPKAGANLGLTLILNEDDGKGRDSFMAWFGNAHTKQVDTAGDLVLLK